MDGSRLKEIRKDHDDTQATLAAKLGFSTATIRKWEQGISAPHLDTICRICRLYHVTSDYLLGLSDEDPLLQRERREKLTEVGKASLRLFETFLLEQESRK